LQDLIDRHIIQCYCQNKVEEVFAQTGEELILPKSKPLVIQFTKPSSITQGRQPVVIQTLFPFPYKNKNAVP